MSDDNGNDDVRGAFDRLRHDAQQVDTMAALRRLDVSTRPRWVGLGVVGVAAAALLIVVGIAVRAGDDSQDSVTTEQPNPRSGDPTPDDGAPRPTGIDGTAWVMASGAGDEGVIPIVDGWPITISFDDGMLGGTAACNGYGGTFELDGDALLIEALSQTEMACDGGGASDVMRSEALFLRALISVDRLTIVEDRLTLSGPSTELVFDLAEPVPLAEFVGQLWLLDTIIEGETASTALGDPATLQLRDDGTLRGGTGCREFSGEYVTAGASVQFTTFGLTGDCSAELQEQDNQVVTVLGDGFTVEINRDRLTLSSRGNEGLSYTAIDEVPDFEPTATVTLEELQSATWTFLEGVGPDGEITPPERFPITMSFSDDTISGIASCNPFEASFELAPDGLTTGPVEGPQEGCEVEEANTAQAAFSMALERVTTASIADDLLVLTGPDTDLVFTSPTP